MLPASLEMKGECLAGIDVQNEKGRTPLMLAAANGDQKVVRALVSMRDQKGKLLVDLNIRDVDHQTALMIAANHGHQDLVHLFISLMAEEQARKDALKAMLGHG